MGTTPGHGATSARHRRRSREDAVLVVALVVAVPALTLGALSIPQLPLAPALGLLVLGLVVAAVALRAWGMRGRPRWRPVLLGAALGAVVTVGGLAWFVAAFSATMQRMD